MRGHVATLTLSAMLLVVLVPVLATGTLAADPATESGSASPSPSPEVVSPGLQRPFRVPVEGIAAIGLLGAVAFAAAAAERRRRRVLAAGPGPIGAASLRPSPEGSLPVGWERFARDDETVGSIEYEPPRQTLT